MVVLLRHTFRPIHRRHSLSRAARRNFHFFETETWLRVRVVRHPKPRRAIWKGKVQGYRVSGNPRAAREHKSGERGRAPPLTGRSSRGAERRRRAAAGLISFRLAAPGANASWRASTETQLDKLITKHLVSYHKSE
ncbi:unnamed protein product [Merluccius merluccius]